MIHFLNNLLLLGTIAICYLISTSSDALAQVAGNAIQSQQKSPRYYDDNNSPNNNSPNSNAPFGSSQSFIGDTSIILQCKVMMNVKADSYVVLLGTAQLGENIETCHTLIDNRINGFLSAIQKIGIAPKDCYVDFVSQVPSFEYEIEKRLFSTSYNEVPNGFEIKKNIHIAYINNDMLNQLLTEAAKFEIYDIIKVDVIINNIASIHDSLRQQAIKLIQNKVVAYSKLGIKFGSTQYHTIAEKIGSVYPVERYDSYTAYSNPNQNMAKKAASGKVIQAPKSKTLYYNKLPYNEFDAIINPQILEPAAQFYCYIQTKYVLKP